MVIGGGVIRAGCVDTEQGQCWGGGYMQFCQPEYSLVHSSTFPGVKGQDIMMRRERLVGGGQDKQ